MMSQKPSSYRKAASSFVNDQSNFNLMQVSPRVETYHMEQRSPFTMTNYASKTNFIGDSLLLPDGPRAVSVSESGEKHLIELDEDVINTNSNPFTSHSPSFTTTHKLSTSTMPKIVEQSSSQFRLSGSEQSLQNQARLTSENSLKYAKRSKNTGRHGNPKHRIVFTPRNMKKTLSTCLSSEFVKSGNITKGQSQKPPSLLPLPIMKITSTETQTDYLPTTSSSVPRRYNSTAAAAASKTTDRPMQMTMTASKNHFSNLDLHELIENPQILAPKHYPSSLQTPLKIYTKTNPNLEKYSELRAIASALTLITVITWLFSTFFDLDSLSHYVDKFIECLQNWFSTKEKPKTKAELVMKFVQDLLT